MKNTSKDKLSSKELLDYTISLLNEDKDNLIDFINNVHAADFAEILQSLDENKRKNLVIKLKNNFPIEALTYLDDTLRDEIIEFLGIESLAPNVTDLDVDDAVDVVEDLEKSDQQTILKSLPLNERKLIEEGLNYPEDSAGRLMQRNYVSFLYDWTVGQAIDALRSSTALPKDFYDIYLVDQNNFVEGIVSLGRLMGSKRDTCLSHDM